MADDVSMTSRSGQEPEQEDDCEQLQDIGDNTTVPS